MSENTKKRTMKNEKTVKEESIESDSTFRS